MERTKNTAEIEAFDSLVHVREPYHVLLQWQETVGIPQHTSLNHDTVLSYKTKLVGFGS